MRGVLSRQQANTNKAECIRRVLKRGINSPKDVVDAVWDEFQVSVTQGYVSLVKWHERNGRSESKPKTNSNGKVDLIVALHSLVETHGLAKVLKIAKLVA